MTQWATKEYGRTVFSVLILSKQAVLIFADFGYWKAFSAIFIAFKSKSNNLTLPMRTLLLSKEQRRKDF